MIPFLILAVIYQVKHFLCDFPLQTSYMLGKFKREGWLLPLCLHAFVHAVGTALIVGAYVATTRHPVRELVIWAPLLDFLVHATMDRIKASPNLMGRWKTLSPTEYQNAIAQANYSGPLPPLLTIRNDARRRLRGNTYFWWALGFDQMVHHLTHYTIVYLLLTY